MFKIIIILVMSSITFTNAKTFFVDKSCKVKNCTENIQNIINQKKYNIIVFPKGEILLNELSLTSNIKIIGENESILIFVKPLNQKKSFLNIEGENNITIENITIKNYSNKSIFSIDGKKKKSTNIFIKNNNIINYAKKNSIELSFNVDNIVIDNNKMFFNIDMEVVKNWKQISHIVYKGKVSNKKDKSEVSIINNKFMRGNCAFRIVTKGLPISNLNFINNTLIGQNSSGLGFYHGRNALIENNEFQNIIATSMKNNDGGVVWLDRYREGKVIFKNNFIHDCIGNAIFVEELKKSIIINNRIVNIKRRINDKFKYSNGGNGILLTNLKNINITNNIFENIDNYAILIDSSIGVPHNKEVKKVFIKENSYIKSKKILKKDLKTKIYK